MRDTVTDRRALREDVRLEHVPDIDFARYRGRTALDVTADEDVVVPRREFATCAESDERVVVPAGRQLATRERPEQGV